jgi:hypothetical protein
VAILMHTFLGFSRALVLEVNEVKSSDVLVFRAHLSPHSSVKSRVLYQLLHILGMVLPCSCLHGVQRYFQVF